MRVRKIGIYITMELYYLTIQWKNVSDGLTQLMTRALPFTVCPLFLLLPTNAVLKMLQMSKNDGRCSKIIIWAPHLWKASNIKKVALSFFLYLFFKAILSSQQNGVKCTERFPITSCPVYPTFPPLFSVIFIMIFKHLGFLLLPLDGKRLKVGTVSRHLFIAHSDLIHTGPR